MSFCLVSVIHSPRAACEPENLRIPLVCSLLSCFLAPFSPSFLLFLPFSISIWTSFCFILLLYCGLRVGMVLSPRFMLRLVQRTLLSDVFYIYLARTHADLTYVLLSERYTTCFSCHVVFTSNLSFYRLMISKQYTQCPSRLFILEMQIMWSPIKTEKNQTFFYSSEASF